MNFTDALEKAKARFARNPNWKKLDGTPWRNDAPVIAAELMCTAVADLQRFKDFVHRRLDSAGIPTHPDGPHSKEGCRIGDRLDIALRAYEPGAREKIVALVQQHAATMESTTMDYRNAADAILAWLLEGRTE